jgi:hypothetical protein
MTTGLNTKPRWSNMDSAVAVPTKGLGSALGTYMYFSIEATSANPKAILSVFSQSGGFIFTLTNQDRGRYAPTPPTL